MYRHVGIFEDDNRDVLSLSENTYDDGENTNFSYIEITHDGLSHYVRMTEEERRVVLEDFAGFFGYKLKKKRKRWWSRKRR